MSDNFSIKIRRALAAMLALLFIAGAGTVFAGSDNGDTRFKVGGMTMASKMSPVTSALMDTAPSSIQATADAGTQSDGAAQPAPAQIMDVASMPKSVPAQHDDAPSDEPLMKMGAGDMVDVQVFGRPELSVSTYIADDGSINMPLVGAVNVSGLSPAQGAQRVADALKKGDFLLNPQVNLTLKQFRSQQVSILGEVRTPGRYPLDSRTGVFDLLAQAGGLNADAAQTGYLLRKDSSGAMQRQPVDLKNLGSEQGDASVALKGGDSLYVPKAQQFYIYGEVRQPNRYRLEPGMIVQQALALGGGVTDRGSEGRIEIRRRVSEGKYKTISARPSDTVEADDVIRVKERIF